ncbi:gallidermin/nisin family lantibiotic [Alicyclobacillus sendaiensis]|uniref:gallidermin/nisin family lantibiotic n=1 Tax=Alicyclobacillus sendaiensis TaxID=192387 RepID=UPI0026F439D4|nr:gallidermin/nisin family lantibiotic [Alicyclobacillus sendaiensis]
MSGDPFDLDVRMQESASRAADDETKVQPDITSISLCTPGCITGFLETCWLQTATCGCAFG